MLEKLKIKISYGFETMLVYCLYWFFKEGFDEKIKDD